MSKAKHTGGRQGGVENQKAPILRLRFLKPELEKLPSDPDKREYFAWDTDEKGLCLCVLRSGVKSFHYRYKFHGRSRRVYLGPFPDLGIQAAQRRARSLRGRIADGVDPVEEARESRRKVAEQAKAIPLARLLEVYTDQHLRPERKPKAAAAVEQLGRDYLAPLLGLKLADVTRKVAAEWHAHASKRSKVRANRALEVLSAACSFALLRDLAPARWMGVNPCHGVKPNREQSRDRYLHPDELGQLLQALEAEPADLRDFFSMLLYTGARRSNVQAMRWRDLDLGHGVWRIGAGESKSGKSMAIPLVTEALAILERRKDAPAPATHVDATGMTWREAHQHSVEIRKAAHADVFVFPGLGATGHLVEPKKAWARLLERAGIEDLRIHDVRRTMGSQLAGQGTSSFVIAKALGHRSLAATGVYARLDLEPVRAAMQQAAEAFTKAGADAKADENKVAPIRARRGSK